MDPSGLRRKVIAAREKRRGRRKIKKAVTEAVPALAARRGPIPEELRIAMKHGRGPSHTIVVGGRILRQRKEPSKKK